MEHGVCNDMQLDGRVVDNEHGPDFSFTLQEHQPDDTYNYIEEMANQEKFKIFKKQSFAIRHVFTKKFQTA